MNKPPSDDYTAIFAIVFFIANLLFVGVFYLALWGLYFLRYQHASAFGMAYLRQALVASSLSTIIFIAINIFILATSSYASLTAFALLELYFMLVVPLFFIAGIIAFVRAIKGLTFNYLSIGRFCK